MLNISKRKISLLCVAIFFSCCVVYFPWEEIRNYAFVDLTVNLKKFEYPLFYFDNYHSIFSLKSFISDEPLWFYLNIFMRNIGFSGELFFNLIAIISLFIFSNYILNRNIRPIYLLLFINPVFLDFVLSQQRNALVFAVLIFFLSNKNIYKYIFLLILPLVHSLSALLIIIFFLVDYWLIYWKKRIFINMAIIIFSLIFSLFLAYGRIYLNSYTDDTRFSEYEMGVNSIVYIFPWILYLIWFALGSKTIDKNYILLMFFLSIYILLTLFNFYGVRFLAMTIPFLIGNILNLKYKKYFLIMFVLHQALLLFFWLKIS